MMIYDALHCVIVLAYCCISVLLYCQYTDDIGSCNVVEGAKECREYFGEFYTAGEWSHSVCM